MNWDDFIKQQSSLAYYQDLHVFLKQQEALEKSIFPDKELRFNALTLTPLDKIRVVILGQDPYHGEGQAHGLSFSVPENVKIPPSLRNIYKELESSISGFEVPLSGDLTHWAKQGVLLLNAVLSVEKSKAGSHAKKGWEVFTDNIIREINDSQCGVIFLLWGNYAQQKAALIDPIKHHILTSSHPSPLSAYRGFLGCQHFKQVNELLSTQNKDPIHW
ncbi:uracil-DNA glycosylase [Psychromonas sp. CNPT3]|uniref:uracil-DNA glycosylase n=1 Tax=Psychromonas sp. CNPT3 TaxID=314282 RepID=UPI00006E42C2|nr:uracil-DNA glycosylase [Psychromonas sp. CNPT3]AGH80703.1 uracil-DNA glycosylase [Psychromonas sp. CNPT3]